MISQFDDIITQAIAATGPVPGFSFQDTFALVNAVIQKESSFDPNATSPTGQGIGLMQVNPLYWGAYVDLYDPYTNIVYGLKILQQYINQYGLGAGLGAYFAGPAQRFTQAAKSYAQSVLNFFSSFKNAVVQLFSSTASSGEYYLDPSTNISQIDVNNIASLPALDTGASSASFDISSYLAMPEIGIADTLSTGQPADYTWLYIAAALIIVLVVIR